MVPATVSVKPATREDVPEILAMIRELAEYEEASTSVEATEASLTRTLTFGPSAQHTNPGFAKTLILRAAPVPSDDEEAAGAGSTTATSPTTSIGSRDCPEGHGSLVVAGMALYFNNYSTWRAKPGIYLEDLYVRPAYRRKGYGKLLLQTLAQEVLRIEGGRLEWSCLKWNEPSLQFYRSIGAREMNDWVGLRVDGEALKRLAMGMTAEIDR